MLAFVSSWGTTARHNQNRTKPDIRAGDDLNMRTHANTKKSARRER